VHVVGISTLACALSALSVLQHLELNTGMSSNDEILIICLSLKVCPLPFLLDFDCCQDIGEICYKTLILPPQLAVWTNAAVLEQWRVQQYKVLAFGAGMHWRLGAVLPSVWKWWGGPREDSSKTRCFWRIFTL